MPKQKSTHPPGPFNLTIEEVELVGLARKLPPADHRELLHFLRYQCGVSPRRRGEEVSG